MDDGEKANAEIYVDPFAFMCILRCALGKHERHKFNQMKLLQASTVTVSPEKKKKKKKKSWVVEFSCLINSVIFYE